MLVEYSLRVKPFCHTLSKALLMSQTLLELHFLTKGIIYVSRSWFTLESPGPKPDCEVVITLWSRKKLKTCLCTSF